jgi:hypothetical protein
MMMLFSPGPNRAVRRARQSSRARTRNGICKAAARAFTGGQLYVQGQMTLAQAAISVGSNVHYIMAAVLLIKSHDMRLIDDAVHGNISIQAAAKLVEPQVMAIEAIKQANPANLKAIYRETGFTNELSTLLVDRPAAERTEAAARLGVGKVWDEMVVPLTA